MTRIYRDDIDFFFFFSLQISDCKHLKMVLTALGPSASPPANFVSLTLEPRFMQIFCEASSGNNN